MLPPFRRAAGCPGHPQRPVTGAALIQPGGHLRLHGKGDEVGKAVGVVGRAKDVRFIRGNDRISQLAQRPDLAAEIAQASRDMEDADRTYAMGLAALRQAAELTQVELARRMGVTQAAGRMEQPHDLLLSTLNAYLEAVGGQACVIVRLQTGTKPNLTSPSSPDQEKG